MYSAERSTRSQLLMKRVFSPNLLAPSHSCYPSFRWLSYRDRDAATCPRWLAPHPSIDRNTSVNERPSSVMEYSTRGGISGYWVR